MILTFISQNLLYGGLRNNTGVSEDRWPQLLGRLTSLQRQPDFVLLQEAEGWDRYGHKALARAAKDLDMDAMPLPYSTSRNLPILLYRADTVGRWQSWDDNYSAQTVHGFGVTGFDIGLPSLLTVASVHLNFFSADLAIQEAAIVANRAYSNGPYAVVGGDMNFEPEGTHEPEFDKMKPYHYSMRTQLTDSGDDSQMTADRRPARKLAQAKLVDVANYMYEKTGDEHYLQPTAMGGGVMRIDQFWVSEPLAGAIIDYQVIDPGDRASDHKGIAFQLDTDKIDTSIQWEFN